MTKKKQIVTRPLSRTDGELYKRPWPNIFGDVWKQGFLDGYDGVLVPTDSDKEYRDGFETGRAQRDWDSEALGKTGSSNA